ncbi:c-type cytochrome biogenesis protein CcmI [Afipia sp. DC4300-2b1]|uniref:c-type cytochrome biogenesis protein CcmI n=1 Tax=Afipia sp. DC4300-2b1 TaxID=2804672 RepID=UPI003CF38BED
MTLWFVFALMTAAAVFAVLWPLGRGNTSAHEGSEAVVYKDQLAEVRRDAAAGMIGEKEAEAARVEISRRLLAASDAAEGATSLSSVSFRRAVAVIALIGLPLVAVGLYAQFGSPSLGDFPLAERSRTAVATASMDKLVAQVETHLEKNPTDGRGWDVLAPVLARIGRYDDAVRAWRNSITYNGESASRRADLGEAIAAASGGVVTAESKAEFDRAIALDPNEVKARYFTGLAAEQDGRKDDAINIWRGMLASAPADAPWRPLVQGALVRVGVVAPKLSDDTIAAAKDMTEGDRNTMIRGMVDRLATRLKDNGNDVEGWLRLVRAYMVLGERDKAQAALIDARGAVGNDAGRLQQLNDGLKSLGLDG